MNIAPESVTYDVILGKIDEVERLLQKAKRENTKRLHSMARYSLWSLAWILTSILALPHGSLIVVPIMLLAYTSFRAGQIFYRVVCVVRALYAYKVYIDVLRKIVNENHKPESKGD